MKVLYVTGARIVEQEGRYYADASFCAIIERYYAHFPDLTVVGKTCEKRESQHVKINSNIRIVQSGTTMDTLLKKNYKLLLNEVKSCSFLIVRVPSNLGDLAAKIAKKNCIKYMTEVVGCAWDALWYHSIKGKILAPFMHCQAKRTVKFANYSLYVTQQFLQTKYPTLGLSVGVSDVSIENISQLVWSKRKEKIRLRSGEHLYLMTAAGVHVRYKGQQHVIRAIPLLNARGINVTYFVAGKGDQHYLKKIAKRYGVAEQVVFPGSLTREQIWEHLDKADIYIQPSLTEGLPRAVVEAMSRGCACLGTNVGGIPELIGPEMLFKPKRHKEIVEKILLLNNNEYLEKIALQNLVKAEQFEQGILEKERNTFMDVVKKDV